MKRLVAPLLAVWHGLAALAGDSPDQTRNRAVEAWQRGDATNALEVVTAGIAAHPNDARLVNLRASMHSLRHEDQAALTDWTLLIQLAPDAVGPRMERARTLFRLGQYGAAAKDFDAVNLMDPAQAPENWERGIALYFAGRYGDARRQFELHQTVNTNDVENAAWHFLCVAKLEGVGVARQRLIPIVGDERPPMRDIHRLYAGLESPDDLVAAATNNPAQAGRTAAFYSGLYGGLYLDVIGNRARAVTNLVAAARLGPPGEFMADVARAAALVAANPSTTNLNPKLPEHAQ